MFCLPVNPDRVDTVLKSRSNTNKLVFVANVGRSEEDTFLLLKEDQDLIGFLLRSIQTTLRLNIVIVSGGIVHRIHVVGSYIEGLTWLSMSDRKVQLIHSVQHNFSRHRCHVNCRNSPLQTCHNVCGIIASICAVICAVDHDMFISTSK